VQQQHTKLHKKNVDFSARGGDSNKKMMVRNKKVVAKLEKPMLTQTLYISRLSLGGTLPIVVV
jgi:hypothetical protein